MSDDHRTMGSDDARRVARPRREVMCNVRTMQAMSFDARQRYALSKWNVVAAGRNRPPVRPQSTGATMTDEEIDRLEADSDKTSNVFTSDLRKLLAAAREANQLRVELDRWRPLTPEEAQRAYDEAEAVPMSEEGIQRIMKAALDPAETMPNDEKAMMVGYFRRLRAENDQLKARIAELEKAIIHTATFCEAAALLARKETT